MSMADALQQTEGFEKNTKVADKYGNVFTVPKGFKIATPTDDPTIVYKEPTNPSVQDGIVIEDVTAGGEGNQFVWIPVGNIKIASDDGAGTKTVSIELARRVFKTAVDNVSEVDATKTKTNGEAIRLDGYSYDFLEETSDEHTASGKKNAIAKEIGIFINGVETNGGYYLARYEASGSGENPAKSVKGVTPWTSIYQKDASARSQAMYNDDGKTLGYQSDLVNSYAWDTAIYYIQECSEDKDYAMQTPTNSDLANTGANTNDIRCNICDMAGNVKEWSTETSTRSGIPCVTRGGYYYSSSCTSSRNISATDLTNGSVGFRPLIYVK